MGNGHRQLELAPKKWNYRESHGGSLRQKRKGRRFRPLSTRLPVHLVFKANSENQLMGFRSHKGMPIVQKTIKRYAKRFHIKVEQVAINHDHLHLIIRLPRRALAQYFFRVVAGQIAQEFEKKGLLRVAVTGTPKARGTSVTGTPPRPRKKLRLWKFRPFSRVARGGWRAYQALRDYVRLNDLEARGIIPYQKKRLSGLSAWHRWLLWASDRVVSGQRESWISNSG